MKVRTASKEDLVHICELVAELGYEADESSVNLQLDTYINSESSLLLVAERAPDDLSGLIAGHVMPIIHQPGNVGRITAFVVRVPDRSAGIGTALLEKLESWFRENDCLRFEVTSGDHRGKAHKFYESKGYVSDERRYLKRRDS